MASIAYNMLSKENETFSGELFLLNLICTSQLLNKEGITGNTSDILMKALGGQIIYLIKFTRLSSRNLLISTFVIHKWPVDPNLWVMDLESSIDFFQRGSYAYINICKLKTDHSDIF